MAYIGLPYYGYCPITVTTNDDGTETESLGTGKITRAVISYAGENDSDSRPTKTALGVRVSPVKRPCSGEQA